MPTRSFTCHVELSAEAGFALVPDGDSTLVAAGVGGPRPGQLVRDGVVLGGGGVDGHVVQPELEVVLQVGDVVVADSDAAAHGHRGAALNRAAGEDREVNGVYGVRCRAAHVAQNKHTHAHTDMRER